MILRIYILDFCEELHLNFIGTGLFPLVGWLFSHISKTTYQERNKGNSPPHKRLKNKKNSYTKSNLRCKRLLQ